MTLMSVIFICHLLPKFRLIKVYNHYLHKFKKTHKSHKNHKSIKNVNIAKI